MPGEHHEIEVAFSEFRQLIKDLSSADREFPESVIRHDELDREICKFEEMQQPVYNDILEIIMYEQM